MRNGPPGGPHNANPHNSERNHERNGPRADAVRRGSDERHQQHNDYR